MGKHLVKRRYEAFIDTPEHVHDGDTLEHVHFKIGGVSVEAEDGQELYPDIFAKQGELWIHTAVRFAGIDAPERYPHHRGADGQLRSQASIDREKKLAMQARQVVVDYLTANDLKFEIRNPELGKYAERIVAEVWAKHPNTGEFVNLSDVLLHLGLAYTYEGGTKHSWDTIK